MNHLLALVALCALFYSTEVKPQTASSSLNITITIPEVLHVVSNRISSTPTGADQQVIVRGNLRNGYCVRTTVAGVASEQKCSSMIGETTFMFRHQFDPLSAPVIGVEVIPS